MRDRRCNPEGQHNEGQQRGAATAHAGLLPGDEAGRMRLGAEGGDSGRPHLALRAPGGSGGVG